MIYMKLNNKGWGLQELIIGIAILFICLWLVSIMIQNSFGQLLGSSSSDKDSGVVENTNPDINIGNENTSVDKDVVTSYTSYSEIEQLLLEATQKYNETIYGAGLLEGDKISVTVKSLVRDGYIEAIKAIDDNKVICSGYVTFIKENDNVTYSPYLKCGSLYTTDGYLERLDADIE